MIFFVIVAGARKIQYVTHFRNIVFIFISLLINSVQISVADSPNLLSNEIRQLIRMSCSTYLADRMGG